MIELRISEIYIPIHLPYKKEKISVLIPCLSKDYKLYLDYSNLTRISEKFSNIILLHDDQEISSSFENFDFLKTTYQYQELDDWVTFYIFDGSSDNQGEKKLKIRFSGKIVVSEIRMLKINTKKLELVSEKSEIHEDSSVSSRLEKLNDFKVYEKDFNCEYIRQIYNIELCYKSIDCAIKRIQCYDGLDFYDAPRAPSYTLISIPCKLYLGKEALYLHNEKDLLFILESIKLTEKFVNLQIEEIELLKNISSKQDDRYDQMNSARRSLKNDFILNIEDIENLLNELDEQNFSIEQFYLNLGKENEEKLKKKIKMEEELQVLKNENLKTKELMSKGIHEKSKKILREKSELEQAYLQKLNSRRHILAENKSKLSKINEEISKRLRECCELEKEINLLDLEAENLKVKTFQQKLGQFEFDSKPKVNINNKSELSLSTIQTKKDDLKQESGILLQKISSTTKNLRVLGFNLQKSLDTKFSQIAPYKKQDFSLTTFNPAHSFSFKFPAFPSFSNYSLNSYTFKSIHQKQALQSISSQISNLLSVQKLQKDLYTKIACDIQSIYSGSSDHIDEALSDFINKNRSLCTFKVIKKSYGIYTFNNKLIHLCIHNNKLTVKFSGSFIPIKDYIIDLKRRSSSSLRNPF